MAKFKYTITKNQGQTDTGIITSNNSEEAIKILKEQGLSIVNIEEIKETGNTSGFFKKKVGLLDKVIFFDHLAKMLKAGLSLLETIEILKDDTQNTHFRTIIEDIKYKVETGNTLSSSMEKYPDTFSHLYIKMIEVGEISGTLEESCIQIATQLKRDYDLRSKVKSALIYPEILLGIMIAAGTGLLVFVIPQLSSFFKQAGLKLPFTTEILISLSTFIREDFIIIIISVIVFRFGFKYLKKNPTFRNAYDRVLLMIPIIGSINKKMNTVIFTLTLGSLLKSGVAIGTSLEIVAASIPNSLYKDATISFKDKVEKGEALSLAMETKPKLFTNIAIKMVSVGDKTGTTPDMLFNVADFYQSQINETLGNISTIIEPVMLFIMGGATLFIALSVISPIYQLTSGISGS